MARLRVCWGLSWLLLTLAASPGRGQEVVEFTEHLDFDRPEAWALNYFTSASLLTGLGPVEPRSPGQIDLGVELDWVPSLDREQRTVGFGGFKEEDLNRLEVWARLRLSIGLPAGFGLTLGWIPPLEIEGVEGNLFALALDRRLWASERWGVGLRLYGQVGETKGDFTCRAGRDERFPPGSPQNPFGCRAPSHDTATLGYAGLEVSGSYAFEAGPGLYLGLAANHLDTEFQVDALTFDIHDRTRLLADGWTWSIDAGVSYPLHERWVIAGELFYTPLEIDRPQASGSENDPLFNLRVLLSYRLR